MFVWCSDIVTAIGECMISVDEKLDKAIKRISSLDGFEKVDFIIQYGSSVDGRMRSDSDIDLAIYYNSKDNDELSRYRFNVISNLFDDVYDIHIFQQLPLYVRVEVLKGNVVYCKNQDFLYAVARNTVKDFDAFKHRYYDYIGVKAIACE